MLYTVQRPVAQAVVGTDIISNETWRIASDNRVLSRIGLTGSAAVGDCKVELFAGNLRIGEFFNSALGVPQSLRDMFAVNVVIPGGMPLVANIADAPETNPIYLAVEI